MQCTTKGNTKTREKEEIENIIDYDMLECAD